MALRLSWKRMLLSIVKPWASIEYWVHRICGSASLEPINSALVELFMFILCFFAIPMKYPPPKDIVDPVCPLVSGWTEYDVSTHHLIIVRLYALKISGILISRLAYCSRRFSFTQSSSSGSQTLVERNDKDVYMYFLALDHANNNCATVWWRVLTRFPSSLFWLHSYLTVYMCSAAGDSAAQVSISTSLK